MPGPPQCARHHQTPAANGVLLLADMLANAMREAVTYGCVTASRIPAGIGLASTQRLRSLCRLCNRSTCKHRSHLCPVFLRAVDIRNQMAAVFARRAIAKAAERA